MRGLQSRLRQIIVVSWMGAVLGSLGIWVLAEQVEMPWWAAGGLLGALVGAFWGLAGWRWSRPASERSNGLTIGRDEEVKGTEKSLRAMWEWLRRGVGGTWRWVHQTLTAMWIRVKVIMLTALRVILRRPSTRT